jgi:hypothetical protein
MQEQCGQKFQELIQQDFGLSFNLAGEPVIVGNKD